MSIHIHKVQWRPSVNSENLSSYLFGPISAWYFDSVVVTGVGWRPLSPVSISIQAHHCWCYTSHSSLLITKIHNYIVGLYIYSILYYTRYDIFLMYCIILDMIHLQYIASLSYGADMRWEVCGKDNSNLLSDQVDW